MKDRGTLYVVGTPIGNLGDITLRAVETLRDVDLIAAEDTRHTRILTGHYNINTPLTSYFEYNKVTKGRYLIGLLKEGKDVALVSDSGTPGISDPGFHIIRLAIENGIPLKVIPGPTALIAALCISGMPTNRFIFEGFLSHKQQARRRRLRELASEKSTVVLYESPHRLLKLLEEILEVLGERDVVILRELTKRFEEVRRGKTSELVGYFKRHRPRGEFVVCLAL